MKSRLLASAMTMAPPPPAEPAPKRKPIPAIGTMRKDSTPAQRKAFQKMKHQMKTAARNIRHNQHLQEREARDKP